MAPNRPLRDIRETESHARIFFEMLKTKKNFFSGLLLAWHREIFGETKADIAGRYRDYPVRVGDHIAPHWKEIPKLVRRFVLFTKKTNTNPVDLAARIHYRFEKIHPFGDGNGRIGRLAMNHMLWQNGYPMLVIEQRKRTAYYKALKKDEESFVRYFIRAYLSAYRQR
jgi:Fic family protein